MSTVIDGSAGVTTNAGGSVNPSTNIAGINYSCRAWVNFDGTGTVAVRASGNVTDITDNGTGLYTVNFTTAISDANYSASVSSTQTAAASGNQAIGIASDTGSYSTTAVSLRSQSSAGADTDQAYVNVAIFR